jgi:aquaporin Z
MKKYFAESVGTFVLVFGGVGSAVLAGDKIGLVGVSFAFGLSLLAMVYTIGPISGCHINPAVTFGAWLSKRIGGRDALAYVAAQILGGIIAGAIILFVAQGAANGYDPTQAGLGANGYAAHSPGQFSLPAAFVAEVILTMFLVLTVLGATDTRAPAGFAGIAIGLVLTLIHLVGIPVTNTSVNPARSIAVAVFVGGWALQQLWLFILAPLAGSLLAVGVYGAVRLPAEVISTREAEEALPSEELERTSRRRAA